jgi:hypothetical protein
MLVKNSEEFEHVGITRLLLRPLVVTDGQNSALAKEEEKGSA